MFERICAENMTVPLNFSSPFFPGVDCEFIKEEPIDVFMNKTETSWQILKCFGQDDIIFWSKHCERRRYVT